MPPEALNLYHPALRGPSEAKTVIDTGYTALVAAYRTMVSLPSWPDYEPTRDVPLVTGTMKTLLGSLDRGILSDVGEGVFTVARDRSRLADEGLITEKASMAKLLENDDSKHTTMLLLHSMPKHLIRAVIYGVTAVMSMVPPGVEGHLSTCTYLFDGPGAYVVSIAVRGRGGKWLKGEELRRIIELLQKYRDAAKVYDNKDKRNTPEERELVNFAYDVDRVYNTHAKQGEAGYMYSDANDGKAASFINGLKSLLQEADDDVPISQAPTYVGCSKSSIQTRIANHTPQTRWHSGKANYIWWLTMSCMRIMNLEPNVVAVPAIRT